MARNVALDSRHQLRVAGPSDVDLVLRVLDAAAADMRRRGLRFWPERFAAEAVAPAIAAGDTWLALRDGQPVGTITLGWADPLWDDDRRAAYIHRLAVVPSAAGLGRRLLGWAAEHARAHGATALRGDCVAGNAMLRSYYERFGATHCGDGAVGGSPGQRLAAGPQTVVSRYQLDLDA